ncbi:hypothetical protein Kpol_1049p2 [Vanderwaltozyma polyspora DSM 70294]|uniref:Phosphodiesterase n=1 Tax=Vanderwaltozyma polyspora (strain ATCC 22028 / DSM 70294 / BCRC 21397 / CBS 2163 / NBRC 10782 / NRRL Y-8283 / UCD 57-17) TaxID=436907 RepID=A7TPP3_VANPO|nr:uncharacterized protein Kpol_1049p2 [Vanderwaltozyma polyspora DSM 70294]EDO15745.1 hypothetical protein Kpol_1049p2 [Vanderwaltozyma polyspora DSM 70294]
MSNLFFVGNLDIELAKERVKFDLFDRIIQLNDFDELFRRICEDRLVPDIKLSYETGISLAIFDPKKLNNVTSKELNDIFRRFLPTFNIVAVDFDCFIENKNFINNIFNSIKVCNNRILRSSNWMYHDSNADENSEKINNDHNSNHDEHSNDFNSCSSNIYSMMCHFRLSSMNAIEQKKRRTPIPRFIRNIDFKSLLKVPKDDDYYLDLFATWKFSANSLNNQELIYCSFLLIKKLSTESNIPISDNKLLLLLFSLEASYHQVNKFHNFRHAVDVMQATYQLCDKLLTKDDHIYKLLLCMAAIGHDIAHPGTNNNLLVNYKSSVALHFDNESVLENFHQVLFQQLLFDQWPSLIDIVTQCEKRDKFNIIKDSILATDMAIHSRYVKQLNPEEDFRINNLISFIIKAADISNVTRPLHVSAQWALLISLEFEDCALLETYEKTNTTSCIDGDENIKDDDLLLSPDDLVKKYPSLPNGQLFFINTFAEEFFNKLSLSFPSLQYLSDNIQTNKAYWLDKKSK